MRTRAELLGGSAIFALALMAMQPAMGQQGNSSGSDSQMPADQNAATTPTSGTPLQPSEIQEQQIEQQQQSQQPAAQPPGG